MDLLSLSASIIAVASLATTLDKALRASLSSLKNAPGELLAISNEVRDLQLVLESVIPMISSEQAMDLDYSECMALLSKLSSSLEKIDHQINQTKTSTSRRADVSSIREKAAQLRKDLRKLRVELILLVSSSQSRSLSTLRSSISLIPKSEGPQVSDTESITSMRSLLSMENMLRQIVKAQDTTSEYREQLLVSKHTLTRLQTNALNAIRKDRAIHTDLDVPNVPCESYHSFFFTSPRQLQSTLGRLTITKTGETTTFWNIIDDFSNTTISYVSPKWLALRGFQLTFGNRKFAFRITDIIPKSSRVFRSCQNGDLEALKELFSIDKASPFATDSNFDTLLHVAVRDDQVKICEFLLASGCDVGTVNNRNRSPADLAWDRIISGVADPAMIRLFLPYDDVLLHRRFSRLHLSVLGLVNEDLGEILQTSTGLEINALDCNFRTPLYWAVRRTNALNLDLLLQYGADPNVGASAIAWSCSNAFATSVCLRSLLEAGAPPDGLDLDSHTALQACGMFGKDEHFVSPLVHAGAYIDAAYQGDIDYHDGITAIGFASLNAHPKTIKVLLEHGANIHWQDSRGRTPLHLALTQSQDQTAVARLNETLNLLLQNGSDLEVRDARGFTAANVAMFTQDIGSLATLMDFGSNIVYPPDLGPSHNGYCMLAWPLENHWNLVSMFLLRRRDVNVLDRNPRTKESVLHLLARYGNQRLLVAFEETADLSQLDGQAFSVSNQTPLDYFNARSDNTEAIKEAFHGLLRRIKGAQPDNPPSNGDPARGDVFYDSEENRVNLYDAGRAALKAETQEDVGNVPTVEKWDGSIGVVNQTSDWEDDLEYHSNTFGRPTYEDQDSEQQLTILAWQGRQRRLRTKRNNSGFDSGYASAESNYSTDAEDERDVEPEEEMTMSSDAYNMPKNTKGKLKRDHKTSLLLFNDPLLPNNGQGPPNQRSVRTGSSIPFWSAIVMSCIGATVQLLHTIQDQEPLLESKALEQPFPQAIGCSLNDSLTKKHLEISLLTTVMSLASPIIIYFSFSMSASLKSFFVRSLRPRIPPNHQRITWVCECGKELYGDFKTKNPSGLGELAAALSSTSSVTSQSHQAPSAPSQVHLRSQQNLHGRPDWDPQRTGSENAALPGNVLTPFTNSLTPKFFELCVNTGEFSKTLGEIDVTRVTSDVPFFKLVRQRYREIRGHRIKKHYLLKPIGMRFVHFGLENGHRVSILKDNSFPSKEDVSQYHYTPCDDDPPMPSDTFMHLMKCSREASRYDWSHRLPKKLFTSITRSRETLPKGWGVHIFEGPDYVNIYFTIICVLSVCTALVVTYVVMTKDVSGAAGIGSCLVAVVTLLWMAMKIEQWKDE